MATEAELPNTVEEHHSLRERVEESITSLKTYFGYKARPLPTETGHGTYIEEEHHASLLKDLSSLSYRDLLTIQKMIKEGAQHKPQNDKEYLMEQVVQLAADIPLDSSRGQALSTGFIDLLWNDLQHPPVSYLGNDYKYRKADGSYNNIRWPQLGAANTPYARSVQPRHPKRLHMPDPGTLFDSLLERNGEFQEHPNKISSMLFYLATIIIHDCFRTSREDSNISLTSSYLDLAPLYGSNQAEQDLMRTFADGKLKPDCFSEKRILGFPPGVSVLLIMFNRFHNYIVEFLAKINENGRFTLRGDSDAAKKAQDEDLFQTGRLITCGLYINIILKDYVRVILNLHRSDTLWDLDPRQKRDKSLFGNLSDEGIGNQVSAEFNLVYRWHSAVSERDTKWTEDKYREVFPGMEPEEIGWHDLVKGLSKWEQTIPEDPIARPVHRFQREADGKLNDDELVAELAASINDIAGAFGANRVPKILKGVEVLGIMQSRRWNLATLNEFRRFFNLKEHETFEDINPDPNVAAQLKHLYGEPDNVELYPGIVVEGTKKSMEPASGLCPGYTISRAILSDAVALVRGDRFYTTDYTPGLLTNWGFEEASSNLKYDQGHVFYKLILRSFPNHFKGNSAWAHYPLVVPSETREILKKLERDHHYDFDAPVFVPPAVEIITAEAQLAILNDKKKFNITWGEAVQFIMQNSGKGYGYDFMLSGDREMNSNSRKMMTKALYIEDWETEVRRFYENITVELLREKSYTVAGQREVDIIADVCNLAQVHFSAEVFNLPLKTKEKPHNLFSERELYMIMAIVFTCIFFNVDTAKSFPLRQEARDATQSLGKALELRVHGFASTIEAFKQKFEKNDPLPKYGALMIEHLLENGLSAKDIVWSHLMGTAGGAVAIQGQLISVVLDFYLREENAHHLAVMQNLAKQDTQEADDQLMHYFMEGARLSSSVGVFRDLPADTTVTDGDATHSLPRGARLFLNFSKSSRDPARFPNPHAVDAARPLSSYVHYGWGPHRCLGTELSQVGLTAMLKVFCRLEGLRRAPGQVGTLKALHDEESLLTMYMTETGSGVWPFPTTMCVRWDGDVPPAEGNISSGKVNGYTAVPKTNGTATRGSKKRSGCPMEGR